MKSHKTWILACAGLFSILLPLGYDLLVEAGPPEVRPSSDTTRSSGVVTTVDLKVQLEKGLRARRPSEFAFLARMLDLVDRGVLPRDLVQSSFNWARKKPSKRVQYFEFALRVRAKRRGIDIDQVIEEE